MGRVSRVLPKGVTASGGHGSPSLSQGTSGTMRRSEHRGPRATTGPP